jgi:hypothetical protein
MAAAGGERCKVFAETTAGARNNIRLCNMSNSPSSDGYRRTRGLLKA